MNIFAWNITMSWNQNLDFNNSEFRANFSEFKINISMKVIFFIWKTQLKTSEEVVNLFKKILWELKNFDISISTEDEIEILNNFSGEWIYEVVTFEWENVTFEEIKKRFEDSEDVISIREAEASKRFGNRTIKVDFVY
jgi:hypothetical protein